MSFDAAAQAQISGGRVRPGIFFRLATPESVRLWSGFGNFPVEPDAVEPDGATYRSGISLGGLPELNALVNGIAERVDFTLSGVDATALALADADAADVRGAHVHLGTLFFDESWAPLSTMAWLWTGEADTLRITRQSSDDGDSIAAVTLSVGSLYTGRRRASLSLWTDPDQRRRSATDRFCERVSAHNPSMVKTWPRFS